MLIVGRVPIYPTEDPDRVRASVMNLFPELDIEPFDFELYFKTIKIDRFIELMRDQRIRDTALMIFRRGLEGDRTSFFLGKQAAFTGKVNFTEGRSTLGDIEVIVEEGALELIDRTIPSY